MHDHDQRFKELIRVFFGDFLRLFFKPWADRLDCDRAEWLDKEVFPDPPDGPRRVLDLLAKVPTRQAVPGQRPGEDEHWLALVHIEIESPDKASLVRSRMFYAYASLRQRFGLPVLPLGLFLNVGLDGIGADVYEERFWEMTPVHFEYLHVGLPALDAIQYMEGESWLGVALAALMKIPPERVAWLGVEALRRLVEAPLNNQQRFMLGECVQAYLQMTEAQQREYDRLLAGEPYRGVVAVNTTVFERGWIQGKQLGVEEGVVLGQRQLLLELLADRFGQLSEHVAERVNNLSAEDISKLVKRVHKAESLADLGFEVSQP